MTATETPAPTPAQAAAYATYSTAELRDLAEELEVDALFHEPGADADLANVRATLQARGLCGYCTAPLHEVHAANCPTEAY